jgi:hypothetical protein
MFAARVVEWTLHPPFSQALLDRADLIAPERLTEDDHIVIFRERHLRHILLSYRDYYSGARTHLALRKDVPMSRAILSIGAIRSAPILGALHHQYGRI